MFLSSYYFYIGESPRNKKMRRLLFNILLYAYLTLISLCKDSHLPVIHDRELLVGDSITLLCPTPRARPEWWQMNNNAIVEVEKDGPVIGRPNIVIAGPHLVINNVSFSDTGTYSCSDSTSPISSFVLKVYCKFCREQKRIQI